ncbi:MAG TPA: 50S ribosomal protein L18 [Candidatus Omnitrophota bacterium]|nr:50S ribosomal protein L18 [Candidatus Omnitrophota bacterium]
MLAQRELSRTYRHQRIRKKIFGTSDRPRLCIHRSLKNLSAQVIDDTQHKVLFGMSTLSKELKGKLKTAGNVQAATQFGQFFAQKAHAKGIKKVCFDRGGYVYHGRVKAFADAARQNGLEF